MGAIPARISSAVRDPRPRSRGGGWVRSLRGWRLGDRHIGGAVGRGQDDPRAERGRRSVVRAGCRGGPGTPDLAYRSIISSSRVVVFQFRIVRFR
jgi:hypothetical protein